MKVVVIMRLVSEFFRHVTPGVIRPLRVLWHEVIGFVFVVFAVFVGFATWRRATDFSGDVGGLLILIASGLFVLLLAYFGLTSFLRARRISRS